MSVEIHGMSESVPCRLSYMTCEVLGIDYKMISCDLFKGENKTPEYLKVCMYVNSSALLVIRDIIFLQYNWYLYSR